MTNAETGVTVIEQSPDAIVEWNLDNWPLSKFNRLVPTTVLGLATDLIRPIVQTVVLDIERDTYASKDLPAGHRAPNALGLAILAAAAGVDFPDETRLDDGSDPLRASAKAWATMVDGAGRTRTVVGSRDYDLSSQPMTDAQRNRAKGYVYEHALTRARHRAMRVLLGLPQSYSVAELQRPFAVVSYVPNLQHPELRAAVLKAMVPTVAALYGPAAAKQLGSGNEVIELPDEDEPVNVTPAPETPTVLPGEKLAAAQQQPLAAARSRKADADTATAASAAPGASTAGTAPEEPDWMRGAPVEEAQVRPEPGLREIIAARLRDDGQPKGPMIARQQEMLKGVFAPFGEERGAALVAGVEALFGGSWKDLTCGQARAIGMANDELGSAAFVAAWRELMS